MSGNQQPAQISGLTESKPDYLDEIADLDDYEICFLDEEPLSVVVTYDGNLTLCLFWMFIANLEHYEPGIAQIIGKLLMPSGWTNHFVPVSFGLKDGGIVEYQKNYYYNPKTGISRWSPVPLPKDVLGLTARCCAKCSKPFNPGQHQCLETTWTQQEYHQLYDGKTGFDKDVYLDVVTKSVNGGWIRVFVKYYLLGPEKYEKAWVLSLAQLLECLKYNGVKRWDESWVQCGNRFRTKISRVPKKYQICDLFRQIHSGLELIDGSPYSNRPMRPNQCSDPHWVETVEKLINGDSRFLRQFEPTH